MDLSSNLPYIVAEPSVQSAVIDSKNNALWIGLKYGGIMFSNDYGETWVDTNNGIPFFGGSIFGPQCRSITISPDSKLAIACNGRIYTENFLDVIWIPIVSR